MKKAIIILLVMVGLIVAGVIGVALINLQMNPWGATEIEINATVTPQPATNTPETPPPTPEIYIARTQAIPGPETFDLPVPCVVEGFATYTNLKDGYCFAFPPDFSLAIDSGISISSGPLDESVEP